MKALRLLSLPFLLAGCARFPSSSSLSKYTRLHFTITFAAPIDDRYVYTVAIRRITSISEMTDGFGPIPVILTGSKNGIVEGRPTQLVQYDRANAQLFTVSTFAKRTPTDADPNPIELAAPVLTGEAIVGIDPHQGGAGSIQERQLEFEISTQDLAKNADGTSIDPTTISAIQFNILSMNKVALTSVSDRFMDALGDSSSPGTISFNNPRQVQLGTADHYNNAPPSQEMVGDTYHGTFPAIDITDWSLDVRTP